MFKKSIRSCLEMRAAVAAAAAANQRPAEARPRRLGQSPVAAPTQEQFPFLKVQPQLPSDFPPVLLCLHEGKNPLIYLLRHSFLLTLNYDVA